MEGGVCISVIGNKPENLLKLWLCLYNLVSKHIDTGKMIFLIGEGGVGKGIHGILNETLLGPSNCARMDFSVFLDRQKMRKNGHLASDKLEVRIQESNT